MKRFEDLQAGDIIYYYDHCKMKPRKIVSCEIIEEEKRIDTWRGYEIRIEKKIIIKCKHGRPIEICAGWNNQFPEYVCWCSSPIFSCKEAAINDLNRLKSYRKHKIQEAQDRVKRYTEIMNKYEILD